MTLAEFVTRVRQLTFDVNGRNLWDDDEIKHNINEAYRQACIRAKLLRRSFAQPIVAGDPSVDLSDMDDDVWSLDTVQLVSQPEIVLNRYTKPALLREYCTFDLGDGQPAHYTLDGPNENNCPLASPISMRLYPTPTEADSLLIEYVAIPCPMTVDSESPAISIAYHEKLVSGALELCYKKKDSDTFSLEEQERHRLLFDRYFGPDYSAFEYNNIQTDQQHVIVAR